MLRVCDLKSCLSNSILALEESQLTYLFAAKTTHVTENMKNILGKNTTSGIQELLQAQVVRTRDQAVRGYDQKVAEVLDSEASS